MLLMVSVQNLPEAMEALRGGADIVDVKNLQEALVGSAHPMTVKAVRDAIPTERTRQRNARRGAESGGDGGYGGVRRRHHRRHVSQSRLHEDRVPAGGGDVAGVPGGVGRISIRS